MKDLIIVESPTKARTIGQYLGKNYVVLSSQGHVRDLPKNDLGVNIEKGFEPKFETRRTKNLTLLRETAADVKHVYLATDHDREGEAIAYDLYAILKRVVKDDSAFSRLIFNEITKPAILDALKQASEIDLPKVEAQRTRRILDRLVGYMLSPLLSRIVAGNRFAGLSAGRVQSVALRFLCDRESQITKFTPEEYWEIDAHLRNGEPFVASVTKKDGKKFQLKNEAEARKAEKQIQAAKISIAGIEEKERRRQPAAPFITSTLQQSASSQLSFSPKRTMRIAQELYEGIALPEGTAGLITYMRTDSVRLSGDAVKAARKLILTDYGKAYLEAKERVFKNKRGSQDAHEAIRPTGVERSPDVVGEYLSPDQQKLYGLIYRRFLATQMTPAVYKQRKILVSADPYTMEAAGSTIKFDGYLRIMPEVRAKENVIPDNVNVGDELTIDKLDTRQKFTEPPRRYSEAGLINLLEKEGIGRPSTYASIISVIQERGYALRDGGSLRPTLLGQMVVDFLQRFFSETIDPQFTAHMEESLDQIEEGDISRKDVLDEFYGPFSILLADLEGKIEEGANKLFRVSTDMVCEKCGAPMDLRFWKGSFFLGCSNYPECKTTVNMPPDISAQYGEGAIVVAEALAEVAASASETIPCETCGGTMELKNGRFGRYYKCTNEECAKTASVSTGVVCPTCKEGELIEKYSTKRRRTFYSCNRYPDCRYAIGDKPVQLCPACEEGVLFEKSGSLVCSNKVCGHQQELEAAAPDITEETAE
ncbi:type I DNA topoisomerase [Candidatus Bipolaricaulota bacterium]|nr:type I DNA topoisomerase [Candidatus Bipolaricaulota bacterium]